MGSIIALFVMVAIAFSGLIVAFCSICTNKNMLEKAQIGYILLCIGMCGLYVLGTKHYAAIDSGLATQYAIFALVFMLLILVPICVEGIVKTVRDYRKLK